MKMKSTAIFAAALALVATAALAQPGKHRGNQPSLFSQADTDNDGAVTQAEWDGLIAALDANKDGLIEGTEVRALLRPNAPELESPPEGRRRPGLGLLFDRDGDGQLESEDLVALFEQLDADDDGTVVKAELPRRRRHHRARGHRAEGHGDPAKMAGRLLARAADGDVDGQVTAGEWRSFLDGLDSEASGVLSPEALIAALNLPPRKGNRGEKSGQRGAHRLGRLFDADRDQQIELEDLDALFSALDTDGNGSLEASEWPARHRS